jgi:predicted nucleic acid-binding protein
VSRIVVADTSPLLYLYLIGQIELLKSLFVEVHIPSAVFNEMCHTAAPETLRKWALSRPDWVNVHPDPELADAETVRRTAASARRLRWQNGLPLTCF